MSFESIFTPDPDVPQFDGFLAYSNGVVGEQVFSAVAHRPLGLDKMEGSRRQVMFGSAKLVWGRIADKDGWSHEAPRVDYQRQLDHYSESGQIMALGDLQDLVHGGRGDRELKSVLPTGRDRPILSPPGSTKARKSAVSRDREPNKTMNASKRQAIRHISLVEEEALRGLPSQRCPWAASRWLSLISQTDF